jgi:hypothetical protein
MNPEDKSAQDLLDYYLNFEAREIEKEQDPEWQKNNMEYDLRTSEYIVTKVRDNEHYAQNLYAALCNNEFIQNDTWPLLTEKTWSCSWRYAGGIIANMREEGDYIDWYCSGIHNEWSDEEFCNATKEDQEKYLQMKNNHVGEGCITEEVRKDLFDIGWLPFDGDYKMFDDNSK